MVITDFATAELVKVAANAFLATKISFINAMAEVCDAAGADVTQLARAIGYDARIGNKFLRAGVGFGGGCLPKDIRAFQARAQELGVGEALRFLHEVDLINQRRRQKVVELAAELLDRPVRPGRSGPVRPADRCARREFQAELRRRPRLAGAVGRPAPVPHRRRGHRLRPGGHGQRRAGTARCRVREDADRRGSPARTCCAYSPSGKSSATPTRSALGEPDGHREVIDGRNCLDPVLWTQAGWEYRGMGRASTEKPINRSDNQPNSGLIKLAAASH